MLFINYTLADEKYISLLPLSMLPLLCSPLPTPASSPFLPQEPQLSAGEYGLAF